MEHLFHFHMNLELLLELIMIRITHNNSFRFLVALLLFALALVGHSTVAHAEKSRFQLEFPLDCTLGKDCWVINYVDRDPGKRARDFLCGRATYNAHRGTDLAILNERLMREGVAIRAVADGRVRSLREGVRDIDFNKNGGKKAVSKIGCGNHVVIVHSNGWITRYCHMKKGSVSVKETDNVKAGDVIGMVGMSGLTEFPHLHLEVYKHRNIVDPFVGLTQDKKCQVGNAPLWPASFLAKHNYQYTRMVDAGISNEKPDAERAWRGDYTAKTINAETKTIGFWANIYRPQRGNILNFRILNPKGKLYMNVAYTVRQTTDKKAYTAQLARPESMEAWPKGTYTGTVRLTYWPKGKKVATQVKQVKFQVR